MSDPRTPDAEHATPATEGVTPAPEVSDAAAPDALEAEGAAQAEGAPADLDYVKAEPEYVAIEVAEGAEIDERGPTAVTTRVRRGVNMRGWIALGIGLGVILSFAFTYAFPEHPDYSRGQVLGFLLVFVTALTTIIVVGIAAIVDWLLGRRTRKITLQREDA